MFSFIIWDALPEMFHFPDFLPLLGGRPVRYYGLLFALGFIISQQFMFYFYRKEGKPEKDVETLTVYMIIATIIGARLGHVLFYEPEKYLPDPIKILKIWEGGLASHGAAFGILAALWVYSKYDIHFKGIKPIVHKIHRKNQNFLQVVDRIVIVVALTGCLIRLGNFMNSEIIGKPTYTDYGVVFAKDMRQFLEHPESAVESVEFEKTDAFGASPGNFMPVRMKLTFRMQPQINTEEAVSRFTNVNIRGYLNDTRYSFYQHLRAVPEEVSSPEINQLNDGRYVAFVPVYGVSRHPAQLYESLTCLLLFVVLFLIWSHYKIELPEGLLLGLFLVVLFGLRFVHELFKENQVAFEDDLSLNMGQILSIPLILAGIFILIRALRRGRVEPEA